MRRLLAGTDRACCDVGTGVECHGRPPELLAKKVQGEGEPGRLTNLEECHHCRTSDRTSVRVSRPNKVFVGAPPGRVHRRELRLAHLLFHLPHGRSSDSCWWEDWHRIAVRRTGCELL